MELTQIKQKNDACLIFFLVGVIYVDYLFRQRVKLKIYKNNFTIIFENHKNNSEKS